MDEPWAAATLRAPLGDPREAVRLAAGAARPHGSDLQLARPEVVASPRHVASAALHALRARQRGRARASDLGLEFLCYLAGDRQIARAVAAAGLRPGAREAIGVALGGAPREALEAAARALGAEVAWELPSHGAAALAALGAPPGAGDPEARALERVALLDLER